jgi:hypothetical protein
VDVEPVVHPVWDFHGSVDPVEPELPALIVVVESPGEGIVDV